MSFLPFEFPTHSSSRGLGSSLGEPMGGSNTLFTIFLDLLRCYGRALLYFERNLSVAVDANQQVSYSQGKKKGGNDINGP